MKVVVVVVEMNLSKHVTKIDWNSAKDRFIVSTRDEQLDEAEAVIVTIPVPQVLTQLQGSVADLIGTGGTDLEHGYSPVTKVLCLFYRQEFRRERQTFPNQVFDAIRCEPFLPAVNNKSECALAHLLCR